MSREEQAWDVFEQYDTDCDGSLGMRELSGCLNGMLKKERIKIPAMRVMKVAAARVRERPCLREL